MSKRFLIAVLLVLVILSVAMVACDVFGGLQSNTDETVYNVYFDSNGGSNVYARPVNEGMLVTEPEEPTRDGYVFDGWYKDAEFKTPWNFATDKVYENITLHAKWLQPVTVQANDPDAGSVNMRTSSDQSDVVFLDAKTNAGYTFLGWFDGDTRVSENSTYRYDMTGESKTFTAKWFKMIITTNRDDAGSVSGLDKTYVPGSRASVSATINDGYVFIGWFDGETLLTRETTYEFLMPSESATYTAKWCKVSVDKNISEAGMVGISGKHSYFGAEATLTVYSKSTGYAFLGWFDGETKLTDDLTYKLTMTDEDKVYTAKFELCEDHNFVDCMCTKCNTTEHMTGDFCRHDSIAYFGSYPQTEVWDEDLVAKLTELAGTLPTADDSKAWTSYGYYFNGSVKDIMWYIDIENAGAKYRGVYFSQVRSSFTATDKSVPNSAQSDNNYNKNNVYWFKYEPIKWRILEEADGKAFLLADIALDSQNYYTSDTSYEVDGNTVSANNYQYSTIRTWLNDTFYETAFNEVQKQMLRTTKLDNSASSMGIANNEYACEYTKDKVFLLSYQETTALTNDELIRRSTDYALCQGCKASTTKGYMGNCSWWTRSPAGNTSTTVRLVDDMGYTTGNGYAYATFYGVVPAVWVAWDGSEEVCNHTLNDKCVCTECGETLHDINDNCICNGCGETFHDLDEDCVCSKCHEEIHMAKGYCRHIDYDSEDGREVIYFGTYPQSMVTDSVEKSVLNSIAGKPSTNSNWIPYGYYIKSKVCNYMYYIDVESMEAKYRGVYFTSYRPNKTTDDSDWLTAYQYDNGYRTNTVYWFRYEPIKWQILDEKDGNAFLFATLALDSQEFNATYDNNYAESTIRAWLNDTFYNTAFSSLQKELILTTNVDNDTLSTSSTVGEDSENGDVCENTQDKVFLLSAQEQAIYLSENSEARRKGTDYTMCQGVHAAISNGSTTYSENLEGSCYWLMRSPSGFNGYVAICTFKGDRGNTLPVESCNGIVPALWIKL